MKLISAKAPSSSRRIFYRAIFWSQIQSQAFLSILCTSSFSPLVELPSPVFFSEPSNPLPLTAHVTWDYGHIHRWMFLSQRDTRSGWSEKRKKEKEKKNKTLLTQFMRVEAADLVVRILFFCFFRDEALGRKQDT